jgi:hypothetical protein
LAKVREPTGSPDATYESTIKRKISRDRSFKSDSDRAVMVYQYT